MSATERQTRWRFRRAESRNGAAAPDAALLAEFQEFLDSRLRPLEQSAAITAGEIDVEAGRVRGLLGARGDSAERIEDLAERLARSTATFAEDVARMRTAIGLPMGTPDGPPSEGVELVIRQMAVAGADADEIEARLAALGVERPREAIDRILASGA
jgi:hypothetical protein